MNLSQLLQGFTTLSLPNEIDIHHLSLDTRMLERGDLFIAIAGSQQDGRRFIAEAIQKGACAVLTEDTHAAINWQNKVPVISMPGLRNQMGEIAAKFYDFPATTMQMIGVTGTSGKTSCTQFIAAALQYLNVKCGVIGTLGNGLFGAIEPGYLTTPDAITLQKTFTEFVRQKATVTTMEVSSHSLDQGRVNAIQFDVGIFTNLTRDHLDYHHTMEAYGAAKKRLFDQSHFAVINADDEFGKQVLQEFSTRDNVYSYSSQNIADVYATDLQLNGLGIKANIITPWGEAQLDSILVGQFNLNNLLAVITALCLLKYPLNSVMQAVNQLQSVEGRMQSFGGNDHQPLVIVDYAHKPDALEKVLIALRQQCSGKLFCVFGCGGERDRGKRPLMAKIAEQYADEVIVTDDNPRHENAADIVKEILAGFSDVSNVKVEHDRSKAIQDTIRFAGKHDCVLIAGKGAETYQLIGDEKFPFNDAEKVKEILGHDNAVIPAQAGIYQDGSPPSRGRQKPIYIETQWRKHKCLCG